MAAAAAASLLGALIVAPPAQAAPITVVSLTFDDGDDNQFPAAQTLVANGLRGTFFINSGFLGGQNYMTKPQVQQLAAAGHEIGGHTVTHLDLQQASPTEAKRQVCQDRANLSSLGLSVSNFAYPFASENAAAQQAVKDCGYNSARGLGDIRTRFSCNGCAYAEKIPPTTPYATKAPDQVESTWTLKDLQDTVTNASRQGGWVQLTFHKVCAAAQESSCVQPYIKKTLFDQFVKWLGDRVKARNSTTQVKTVAQVINKPVQPVVDTGVPAPAGPGVNAVKNPSVESVGGDGVPACYLKGGYGANSPTFATTGSAKTGAVAEQLAMANYVDGDAKLLPQLDLGDCSPTVVTGRTYSLREWYKSTAVTQFALYLRNKQGTWIYWTSSPWYAASDVWTQADFTTAPIPDGYDGLSFGLNLFNNGTLVTDDYAMYDSEGAPAVSAVPSTDLPASTANNEVPGAEDKGTVQVPEEAEQGE